MLTVQLINELAEVNNYIFVGSKNYIAGLPFHIKFQIGEEQLAIRLMAKTASKMIGVFQTSTGGTLTKTGAMLFNPDDKSMWSFSMTAADSLSIVGSNFQVFLDLNGDSTLSDLSDATVLLSGMAYNVLSKTLFDGEC